MEDVPKQRSKSDAVHPLVQVLQQMHMFCRLLGGLLTGGFHDRSMLCLAIRVRRITSDVSADHTNLCCTLLVSQDRA